MKKRDRRPRAAAFVAPMPMAIPRGPYQNRRLPDEGRFELQSGDPSPFDLDDNGMRAFVAIHGKRLEVSLAFRVDDFSDDEWQACAALPSPLAMAVHAPLVFFLVEISSHHFKAPYPVGYRSDVDPALLHRLAAKRSSEKELVVYGVAKGIIRSVKVGIMMPWIWRSFADALASSKGRPTNEDIMNATRADSVCVSADLMFSTAMRSYLEPRRSDIS